LAGGASLQPVLYALAAEKPFGAGVKCGRITSAGGFSEQVVPLDDPARRAADAVADTIRNDPHVLVRGRSLHEREEIIALRNALTAIEWPDDELKVFATLRGPLFALSDEALLAFRQHLGADGALQIRRLHPMHSVDRSQLNAAAQEVGDAHRGGTRIQLSATDRHSCRSRPCQSISPDCHLAEAESVPYGVETGPHSGDIKPKQFQTRVSAATSGASARLSRHMPRPAAERIAASRLIFSRERAE